MKEFEAIVKNIEARSKAMVNIGGYMIHKEAYDLIVSKLKSMDIDKAWNYYKDMLYSWCLEIGRDPEEYIPVEKEKFRKMMEE
ncbi:MAG: hypothetical protein MJZ12_00025 [Prevotella sp.]|nr:hypothetical protein [Prevotella sp.]